MMLGLGLGMSMLRRSAPAWTPADLAPGVLLAWFGGRSLGELAENSDGTGAVVDASRVGRWRDLAAGKHLVQTTSGDRPVAGYSALGRGFAVFGNGTSHFLAATSSTAGAVTCFAAISHVPPPLVRGNEADEPDAFSDTAPGAGDGYQAYVGGNFVANPSSSLLVGHAATPYWLASGTIAGAFRLDGVVTSPALVGRLRQRRVHEFERTVAMDTGNLRVLAYATNALFARGAMHEFLVLSGLATADDKARVREYMAWHRGAPLVVYAGDSLVAGKGVTNHQAHPSVVWSSRYRGCVSVVNLGVPGETSAGALANDPAKLDSLNADLASKKTLVLAIGPNDFLNGLSGTWANVQSYVTMARARGYEVILSTVADAPIYTSLQRSALTTFNGQVAGGWSGAGAAGLADLYAAAPEVGVDDIHWTAAGHVTAANTFGPQIDTLLAA